MSDLTGAWAKAWVKRAADTIHEHASELSHLDRNIGDGDHGANMDRGFAAAQQKVAELGDEVTPAEVLKTVATTLISTVGGASGPLFGTAFLKGSTAIKDRDALDADGVTTFLQAARDGVVMRGKAAAGDKTMVDALTPAVDAASAKGADADPADVLAAAASAAEEGAAATEPLVARKGRASYLGERAVGHRDPGAQSTAYLLEAAAQAAKEMQS